MLAMATRYPLDRLKQRTRLTDDELARRLPCGWCSPCRRGRPHACEHPGVTDRTIRRLRESGLTNLQADRYAIACGQHPAYVWPGWDGDRDVRSTVDTG